MDKPLECSILSKTLGESPLCMKSCSATETPSYIDDKNIPIPKGCLIAHLALTLIEMQRISSYFKIPLHNLFAQYDIEDHFKTNIDVCWKVLLTSSLLHDIGKLVDQYITKKKVGQGYVLHHQISAVIAKKILENIANKFIALGAAYGILFHHEAIDWIAVEKSFLHFSYIQKALSPTRNVIYSVSKSRLSKFEQNVCSILDHLLDKHILTELEHQTLTLVSVHAVQKLIDNQGVAINVARELNVAKIEDPRNLTPALALYRLLYLADNRAASARERYWLEEIGEVDWKHTEDVAWQIINRLARRYRYVGLSSIPIHGR